MRKVYTALACLTLLMVGLGNAMAAETLTPPAESLNSLRPGTLTVAALTHQFGNPAVKIRADC